VDLLQDGCGKLMMEVGAYGDLNVVCLLSDNKGGLDSQLLF